MFKLYELNLKDKLKKEKPGWKVYKGIRYRVKYYKKGTVKSIIIICPRCGKLGNLTRSTWRGKDRMRVFHKLGYGTCTFGSTDPWFDVLKELYYKVRCNVL